MAVPAPGLTRVIERNAKKHGFHPRNAPKVTQNRPLRTLHAVNPLPQPSAPGQVPKKTFKSPPIWVWVLLVLAALLAVAAALVVQEARDSRWQARYLAELGRKLTYTVQDGPSESARFPDTSPYDDRLGYSHLPAFSQSLRDQGYHVTRQAAISPGMVGLADLGLNLPYPEKDQAGLEMRDCRKQVLFSERFPVRQYPNFAAIPQVLADTLLFIEDRNLLSDEFPERNPVLDGKRFAKAVWDQVVHVFVPSHPTPGGSTLATQIEKYRHSPQGLTGSGAEKLRQMASASVKVYRQGEHTLGARQNLVTAYLNTVPLAAKSGFGEVNGMGDGLWVWYGQSFDTVNPLLRRADSTLKPDELQRKALAYKQALSLLISQRRPSYYLRDGVQDLAQLTDSHLRVLAEAGVISQALRDAALAVALKPTSPQGSDTAAPYVARKAINALRSHVAGLLHLNRLYDLDRLDLAVDTTIDGDLQQTTSTLLRQLREPANARAAELYGHNLLRPGDDPSKLVFSFTLFERRGGANVLRVQTDNVDQPFDINEGARLNLGSTAKLRTLVTYLEVVSRLHARYGALTPPELAQVRLEKNDVLRRWALDYLATAPNRELPPMLEAAMDRRYSGNPAEAFVTGGGVQSFSNFDPGEDHKMLTIRESFRHSVNLVFVRMMRDIVRYYQYPDEAGVEPDDAMAAAGTAEPGPTPLVDRSETARQTYLSRFADQESRAFMVRFFKKYRDLEADKALALLLQSETPTVSQLAAILRGVDPQADLDVFSSNMRQKFAQKELSDQRLEVLYERYAPEELSWSDRGYIARVHPLELWLLGYLRQNPQATLSQALQASYDVRQSVYDWLFNTRSPEKQDKRIRQMQEKDAFIAIARDWRRLGYPFESLTPSYATALGASGDRPAALSELMGIIVNKGVRLPVQRVSHLAFAHGTPFETHFEPASAPAHRLLPEAVTEVARHALLDVVQEGTARRLRAGMRQADDQRILVGGKTGTGDHRYETYGANGRLIESRAVNRSATFVFLMGERFFGTMTAYVAEPYADNYRFTSGLTVQLLKSLTPALLPLLQTAPGDTSAGCMPEPSSQ